MSKFHINKHGVPAPCKATKGNCPYGGATGNENHYDSLEEAQATIDAMNEQEFGILGKLKQPNTEWDAIEKNKAFWDSKVNHRVIMKSYSDYDNERWADENGEIHGVIRGYGTAKRTGRVDSFDIELDNPHEGKKKAIIFLEDLDRVKFLEHDGSALTFSNVWSMNFDKQGHGYFMNYDNLQSDIENHVNKIAEKEDLTIDIEAGKLYDKSGNERYDLKKTNWVKSYFDTHTIPKALDKYREMDNNVKHNIKISFNTQRQLKEALVNDFEWVHLNKSRQEDIFKFHIKDLKNKDQVYDIYIKERENLKAYAQILEKENFNVHMKGKKEIAKSIYDNFISKKFKK